MEVAWTRLYAGAETARVPLPGYAFRRQRYWPEPPPAGPDTASADGDDEFWAALEQADVDTLRGELGDDDEQVRALLRPCPCCPPGAGPGGNAPSWTAGRTR
ncbi:hypothetical protein [Micromonospora sp. b486]|uniref:hypothetical protein n=1 Tax=Micromonospora sp. b486 TaxID=3053986 RepID=UPI00259C8E00|nr:hypothetical protein [Micromonospora sp. b486]MDM4784428.1 hypothetical protein [Micromonospora sp. b486]